MLPLQAVSELRGLLEETISLPELLAPTIQTQSNYVVIVVDEKMHLTLEVVPMVGQFP